MYDVDQHTATVFIDNQSAMKLATDHVCQQRTKHIDIRFHFIRDHIKKGDVVLKYIPSSQNRADALTKPLSGVQISKLLF